jgi:hypothetical protein
LGGIVAALTYIRRVTPRLALILGSITLPLGLADAASAQVVLLSDLRRVTLGATATNVTDSFLATPPSLFADFSVPTRTVNAAFGNASVTANASHLSSVLPQRMTAQGTAVASGSSAGSDPGSAQASSTFFVGFRLLTPQRFVADVALSKGVTANAQFILQRSDGSISYFLNADAPQPISITRTLPPGDYTLVAFASTSVALFPGATLADACGYSLDVSLFCPADFNADGFLDFFDYDAFVDCFETGTCPHGNSADFNADGFADFFDYDDFVAAYEIGC